LFTLGLVINAPWIFDRCWYIIKRWLDPVVESKIHFVNAINDLSKYIDPLVLPKRLNRCQSNFKHIPPTNEDLAMLSAFRNNKQGKQKAEEVHRQVAKNYLNITYKWTCGDESNNLLEKREKERAEKEVRDIFEQIVPHIHTRTHYHRSGQIDQSIFYILYEKIQNNTQQ
ncbi:unnamed protein product, partial [Rotaria sp. Silwood2]